MKLARPDLAAYALAALGILCLTALLTLGRNVPEYFPLIVFTLLGTGGGLALNTPQGKETITTSSSPAPAPVRSSVPAPRPAPVSAPAPVAAPVAAATTTLGGAA